MSSSPIAIASSLAPEGPHYENLPADLVQGVLINASGTGNVAEDQDGPKPIPRPRPR